MPTIPVTAADPADGGFSLGGGETAAFNVFPPADNGDGPIDVAAAEIAEQSDVLSEAAATAVQPAAEQPAAEATGQGEGAACTDSAASGEPCPSCSDTSTPAEVTITVTTVPPSDCDKPPRTREEQTRDAELAVCEIGLEIEEIRSRMADDKKRLKHLLEDLEESAKELRDLREGKDVQQELPLADKPSEPAAGESTAAGDAVPIADTILDQPFIEPAPAAGSEAWRTTPISQIDLTEIKGFGKKKMDLFVSEVKTIGGFEDRRALAASKGEPLHKHLPKGVGKDSAEIIMERVLTWLTENRDRPALAAGGTVEAAAGAAGDNDPEHGEEAELRFLKARATELQGLLSQGAKMPVHSSDAAQSGKHAAENDDSIDVCAWAAGDEQDSWLIGYLSVKSIEPEPAEAEAEAVA